MYDNTCKYLAENFPEDLSSWLLGVRVSLVQMQPTELSVEPIRADSMILLTNHNLILHVEFQTVPDREMGFRMLDYRVRAHRKFPGKQMRQIVIYLTPTTSDLVSLTTFELESTHHEFEVIRLWEQPSSIFLVRWVCIRLRVWLKRMNQSWYCGRWLLELRKYQNVNSKLISRR